jgi:hypothetical protein
MARTLDMGQRLHRCERCGEPALVHIMHEVGRPGSVRHLCMTCADGAAGLTEVLEGHLRRGLRTTLFGLLVLTVSLIADQAPIERRPAPGLWQIGLFCAAILMTSCGSLSGVTGLSVTGLLLLTGVLTTGYLDGRRPPAMGTAPAIGVVLGVLMIAWGMAREHTGFWRRVTNRDSRPAEVPLQPVHPRDPANPRVRS